MSKKALLARIDAKTEPDTTEYGIIESAVSETARGRWFLKEYARRNRYADTQILLEAINKLYERTGSPDTGMDTGRIRLEIKDMLGAIDAMRHGIKEINAGKEQDSRIFEASGELDSIVVATEKATSRILDAAEHVQETAWTMREQGIDELSCDKLDALATEIYTACSFQDITGQRTGKVIEVLQYLETRINRLADIWGAQEGSEESKTEKPDAHLLNGPCCDESGVSQKQIDEVLEETSADEEPQKPAKSARPPDDSEDEEEEEELHEDENTSSRQPAAINMSSLNSDDMHALFSC